MSGISSVGQRNSKASGGDSKTKSDQAMGVTEEFGFVEIF